MREARAIVNAVVCFCVFLVLYAALIPGHARSSSMPPRFLRMEVDDDDGPSRTYAVPYVLFGGPLRALAAGKFRRELNLRFDESVAGEELRQIWKELSEKPRGEHVLQHEGDRTISWSLDEKTVVIEFLPRQEEPPAPEAAEAEGQATTGSEEPVATTTEEGEKVHRPRRGHGFSIDLDDPLDHVTLRLPASLIEAAISEDRDLDVDTLVREIQKVGQGGLVDVKTRDGRIKVWVE